MAAPSVVQSKTGIASGTGSLALTFDASVTAGSLLVAAIRDSATSTPTFGVTDSLGNTWTQAIRSGSSGARPSAIWYCLASLGGACTVTITSTDATASIRGTVIEATYAGSCALDQTSSQSTTTATTHPCAASGAIDTAADVLVVAVGMLSASSTTGIANGSYTALSTDRGIVQYRASAGALTDERGDFTTAANQNSVCAIASFAVTGGAPPATWTPRVTMVMGG